MALALSTAQNLRLSPASSKQNTRLSSLSKGYKALSMTDKSTWIALAQSANTSGNRTGRRKLTAANLYTQVNSVRLTCLLPVLSTAPQNLPSIPDLPDQITVVAVNNGTFTCTVDCSAAYGTYVQVKAPPIAPAGYNKYAVKSFRVLGVLPALSHGATSVAALYVAKYGVPPVGAEVVLELIPMDILGDKLKGRIVTGVVGSLADTNTEDDLLEAA